LQLKKLEHSQSQSRVFDVADTASGTDWIIISHHQFLMHCLQHLNKHLWVSNMNSCNMVLFAYLLNVHPPKTWQLSHRNTVLPLERNLNVLVLFSGRPHSLLD